VADTAERKRIVARGRVQGVWYREACRRHAEGLGLAGWARNLDDGTVEVVAEGESEALDELVAWCRQGPPRALVVGLDVRAEPPQGLAGFRTR
jgi:acylphosphatase